MIYRLKTLSCMAFTLLAVIGCSTAEHEDLKGWMNDQAKGMKGKVPPLPEIKPFPVVSYEAEKALSPFSSSKVLNAEMVRDQATPTSDRPREPLENFPIDELQLTGIVFDSKKNSFKAIVQTPQPNKPLAISVGAFLGKDFGKVIAIDHCKVSIEETVKDTNGVWTPRPHIMKLSKAGGRACNLTAE
jgi:type IV pilus assembly protein PilP